VADAALLAGQHEGRRRFLELVVDLRPELHRYCARMTGSVADGEDIVQDTLARAYYLLPEMDEVPAFRPWLFRIAHNRALDHLRRYEARMGEPLEAAQDNAVDPAPDPGDALAHEQAVQLAVSRFVGLAPAQRSCVILKDVLGHSLEEIGGLLELSSPAVKAALHRGRVRLRELAMAQPPEAPPRQTSPAVARYAALFNRGDWDGLRAMLADDVRLVQSTYPLRAGAEVRMFFGIYAQYAPVRLAPAWLDGREVIAVYEDPQSVKPSYLMWLEWTDGRVSFIRDYRYVRYVVDDAELVLAPDATSAST